MQRRLAQASVVFTTAVVGPGEKRFLVPLRPALSNDAPAIPFVLPPSSVIPASNVVPAEAGTSPPSGFTVAWRKPIFPAHMKALADPNRDYGAKTRAAQTFLIRALADGPRPASEIEREAALIGLTKRVLHRARAVCGIYS